jgi:LPXTG-site transpeptidase (sortase) family protein
VTIGFFLVSNAVWPILSYFVFTSPDLADQGMLSPVPADAVVSPERALVQKVQAKGEESEAAQPEVEAPVMLAEDLDYTNLSNWFPDITPEQEEQLNHTPDDGQLQEYILDIPTLNVEEARVKVGGSNLDKSLIHYPGTANPGDPGSPVIFGHSVLRQFYNPSLKNPRRYMSIFSKIMTLKQGDKIYLTSNGVKYTYVVEAKAEVKPTDTFILEQNFDNRGLKLITCVPEGTFLRRGVVIARLEAQSDR